MNQFAVFSDIHGNWEALDMAVQYSRSLNIQHYAVLGDSIGYGANPNECFDWVVKNAGINLMGNHEKAVIDPRIRDWFNPMAKEAIEWTERVFDVALKRKIESLPYIHIDPKISFAHASLADPEKFSYITSNAEAEPCFQKLENQICFIGHTHVPGCFCKEERSAVYLAPGKVFLDKKKHYLLNPGSVGQPRDRDRRLSFGVFDEEEYSFEIIRLDYDNIKAAEKIRKAGLPAYLADRLL